MIGTGTPSALEVLEHGCPVIGLSLLTSVSGVQKTVFQLSNFRLEKFKEVRQQSAFRSSGSLLEMLRVFDAILEMPTRIINDAY